MKFTFRASLVSVAAALVASQAAAAETVVQVPLTGVLDARSVTTLTNGVLVPWTLPTDGGGLQNAYATMAVATKVGAPPANALPDDGKFAANARHPEVVLNYSNTADAAAPQTHLVKVNETVSFAMPAAVYSKVFLFFNGAAGGSPVTFTLTYADGMETQTATVPDYYADISATDPVIFNLATNLAKYDKTSKVTEANHHNITGVELHPGAGKTLTKLSFVRGAMGNLVFWGATGIATSDVAGAGGAGGAAGTSGASGANSAGAGGAASGAGGSGGELSSSAGMGGASTSGSAGASAGSSALGGAAPASGGSTGVHNSAPADDGGCRFSAGSAPHAGGYWLTLAVGGALYLARRRRA